MDCLTSSEQYQYTSNGGHKTSHVYICKNSNSGKTRCKNKNIRINSTKFVFDCNGKVIFSYKNSRFTITIYHGYHHIVDDDKIELTKSLDELQEVELYIDNIAEEMSLKKPSEVYYEIYKAAREKAKHMKQAAIEAYLHARNIKTKYMLDEINNSEDELSNFSEIEE